MKSPELNPDATEEFYLTDGGLETTLIFHQGLELRHFAAFELVNHSEGQAALRTYYQPYLEIARQYGLNFIMETPTWRANPDWGAQLGYSAEALDEVNRQAVRFMRELASSAETSTNILVSGNIGPRGDGYVADQKMSADEARKYHRRQVEVFAQEQVDVVTALTINYIDEGVGVVKAAEEAGVPVVISFTVETNGQLPSGESLTEAIEKTDRLTDRYAAYFMINCAHPEHFQHILEEAGAWKSRIRGIRANASTKSHAELDESETLDTGDQQQLAEGYERIRALLPNLSVVGGCCGTDHQHLAEICRHLLASDAPEQS